MAQPDAPPGFDPPSALLGIVPAALLLAVFGVAWFVVPGIAFIAAFVGQIVGFGGLYMFAERRERAVSVAEQVDDSLDGTVRVDGVPVEDTEEGDFVAGSAATAPRSADGGPVDDSRGPVSRWLAEGRFADHVDRLDLPHAAAYFFGVLALGCVAITFQVWQFF